MIIHGCIGLYECLELIWAWCQHVYHSQSQPDSLQMKWTPWSFLGEEAMMSPHDGGTHLECMEVGVKALSQIISDESFSYSLKHILQGSTQFTFHGGPPTPYIYIFCFQDDVMKWKYAPRYWPFVRGIHRSLVNSPHKGQWHRALMFSFICAWPNGWVNNQDADDLRRHRAHYDVTVMWYRIVIQWSGQPWDLSAFKASLLSNFELVKRVKLGGSVLYGRNVLKVGTLLYPDYDVRSSWSSFEMGRK